MHEGCPSAHLQWTSSSPWSLHYAHRSQGRIGIDGASEFVAAAAAADGAGIVVTCYDAFQRWCLRRPPVSLLSIGCVACPGLIYCIGHGDRIGDLRFGYGAFGEL